MALFVAGPGTWWALTQPPHPDVYSPRSPRQLAWWLHPLEWNAYLRLPLVTADLNDVFTLRQGGREYVWVVGNAGTILHSKDGGRTWEQQSVPPPETEIPAQPGPAGKETGAFLDPSRDVGRAVDPASGLYGPLARTFAAALPVLSDSAEFEEPPTPSSIPGKENPELDVQQKSEQPVLRHRVSGSIRLNQAPLPGVVITLRPKFETGRLARDSRLRTDEAGRFEFTEVVAETYLLRPGKPGFTFVPREIEVRVNRNVTQDFEASYGGNDLNAVHFVDARRGWIVGEGGTLLVTENSGTNWRRQPGSAWGDQSLVDVVFASDGQTGIILDERQPWRTDDGGETWTAVGTLDESKGYFEFAPSSAAVIGERTFFANDRSHIFKSVDGGRTWLPLPVALHSGLIDSYAFVRESFGFLVSEGRFYVTKDGGETWSRDNTGLSEETEWLQVRAFANSTVVVLGSRGDYTSIAFFTEELEEWQFAEASKLLDVEGEVPWVTTLHFAGIQRGWFVGPRGWLHTMEDGGRYWAAQTRTLDLNTLKAVLFDPSADPPWQLAPEGQSYRRLPAPWYFATWPVIAFLLAPVLRRSRVIEDIVERSVADEFVSDRPISVGDRDALDFLPTALGLSRFLRNESTAPPLTVAITGRWGTGKSSLMNLVRGDLDKNGFRTVWFNAWHHQKEEHLLAALLENIRAQAIPGWVSRQGLAFRARLAWARNKSWWRLWLVAGLPLAVLAGFVASAPTTVLMQVQSLFDSLVAFGAGNVLDTESIMGWVEVLLFSSKAGGLLTIFAWILRSVRTFKLKPAKLAASVRDATSIGGMQEALGFRFHFEREFRRITQALRGRLVIFIDDLDRCRAESAVEVLESINFLVSCGECFIILGTDLEYLERCVDTGYKDEAIRPASAENNEASQFHLAFPEQNGTPRESGDEQENFALRYLQKLINIEVPVPQPAPRHMGSLIGAAEENASSGRSLVRRQKQLRLEAVARRRTLVAAAAILFIAFGIGRFWAAQQNQTLAAGASNRRTDTPRQGNGPRGLRQPPPANVGAGMPRSPQQDDGDPPAVVDLGRDSELPRSWAAWIFLAVGAFGVWRLTEVPDGVTKDSSAFRQALKLWLPFVLARKPTPRSLKRFLNQVRYCAMRTRPVDLGTENSFIEDVGKRFRVHWRQVERAATIDGLQARWQRVGKLRERIRKARSSATLSESKLVALGVLAQFGPSATKGQPRFNVAGDEVAWKDLLESRSEWPTPVLDASERGRKSAASRFHKEWKNAVASITPSDRVEFHRLSAGVRLS